LSSFGVTHLLPGLATLFVLTPMEKVLLKNKIAQLGLSSYAQ
jgi:hypothetical protein